VCFAHAGATEAAFASWPDLLGETIEVAAVCRPPLAEYQTLIEVLTKAVSDYVSRPPRLPHALFGHSLGSLLAFGVARQLRQRQLAQPCCLLCTSASAPQLPTAPWPYPPPQDWSIHELVRYLRDVGGTAEKVLCNPLSLQRLLPRLQKGLAARASFSYTYEPPLAYPLAVFGGQQDASIPMVELAAWETQTSAHCSVYRFPGGHFFLHDPATRRSFVRALSFEVTRWLEDEWDMSTRGYVQGQSKNGHDGRTRHVS
jgi:medium-chain acyl-[acyl-carrier-protein] hydrolase